MALHLHVGLVVDVDAAAGFGGVVVDDFASGVFGGAACKDEARGVVGIAVGHVDAAAVLGRVVLDDRIGLWRGNLVAHFVEGADEAVGLLHGVALVDWDALKGRNLFKIFSKIFQDHLG